MIDHLSTYATNFLSTRAFYESALAVLGYSVQYEMVLDADPESPRHVAFSAEDRGSVVAFHKAGMAAGGQDFGAPGPRPIYHEHYYGAFLTDPDGNNVEAVCRVPERPEG